jgi:outer membrane receptor protein involved in Fe transport
MNVSIPPMYAKRLFSLPGPASLRNALLLVSLGFALSAFAPESLWAGGGGDKTLLMFVGENLEVLTIASRREESARKAPAVAGVVTREQFREQGRNTLGEILETQPGFHMAPKEAGTRPFLRGIPESVLFLYDTVPLSSDLTKSFHPLDRDLSLAGIKRVEIIRGPGSVLWGPDAFAGIVNLAPMTGKDVSGIETGVEYGEPEERKSFFFNLGRGGGEWDGFLSLSGNEAEGDDTPFVVTRFWGDGNRPVPSEERFGFDRPGNSDHLEASGSFSLREWFTLSGRIAQSRRAYALASEPGISWEENRDHRTGYLKLESRKHLGDFSALRWMGSLTWLDIDHRIIDRELDQRERTAYAELIYDHSLPSGNGAFTGGISYREKRLENAPIWEGYFPDFLGPENEFLLPILSEVDYDARLRSAFGQYNHRFGDFHGWLGLRYDDHDAYRDHLTYNVGVSWSPSAEWVVKLIHGTAYRTPFARQLREAEATEPERIRSVNLQVVWEPTPRAGFGVTGFWNGIEDHVMEDPFAGLSRPNRQETRGAEIQARFSPVASLEFAANLTLIDNSGPEEEYRLLLGTFVDADGNVEKVFEELSNPYNGGPDVLGNLTATWKPSSGFVGHLRLGYTSSRRLIFPRGDGDVSTPSVWRLDAAATFRDVGLPGLDLEIFARNALDERHETPGTYTRIEGDPAAAGIILRKKW